MSNSTPGCKYLLILSLRLVACSGSSVASRSSYSIADKPVRSYTRRFCSLLSVSYALSMNVSEWSISWANLLVDQDVLAIGSFGLVHIWVILFGQLKVGLLDLGWRGVLFEAKGVVEPVSPLFLA